MTESRTGVRPSSARLPAVAWAFGACLWIGLPGVTSGKPIDQKAAEHLLALGKTISAPLVQRQVEGADLETYLRLYGEDNQDRKLCALLAFAYATDERSRALLLEAEGGGDPLLAGVAAFGLTMRTPAGDQRRSALTTDLVAAKYPIQRAFAANRLAIDHPKQGVPAIMRALESETNGIVRCEMIYHIQREHDPSYDRRLLAIGWNAQDSLPENLAFTLGVLTPGRSPREAAKTIGEYLNEIRSRNGSAK